MGRTTTSTPRASNPAGPDALPPPLPKDEYSLGNVFAKEANIFAEYTGLYGFVAKSAYQGRSLHPAGHKNARACAPGRTHPATIHATPLPGSLFLYIKWKSRDRSLHQHQKRIHHLD